VCLFDSNDCVVLFSENKYDDDDAAGQVAMVWACPARRDNGWVRGCVECGVEVARMGCGTGGLGRDCGEGLSDTRVGQDAADRVRWMRQMGDD